MNKNEIITLILVFLIAGSSIAYMMYSEDIGKAWSMGKRRAAPRPVASTPTPTPVPAPTEPRCTDVIINGPPEDKINVVFIGINYPDNSLFTQHVNLDIDWNGQNYGLFSFEPYKTQKEYFNFYRIDNNKNTFDCLGKTSETACGGAPYNNIRSFVKQVCGQKLFKEAKEGEILGEPYIEVLLNDPSGGNAGWSPIGQRVSLMWSSETSDNPSNRQVFTHELGGHAIAGLQDEYRGTIKEPTQTFCSHQYCKQTLEAMGYGETRPEESAPNCDKAGCSKWAKQIVQDGINCVAMCGGYEDLYHPTKCQMILDKNGDPIRKTQIGKDGLKYTMKCSIMDRPLATVTGKNNQGKEWNINPKEIEIYTYAYFDRIAQGAILKQLEKQAGYPFCKSADPECAKARQLFKLIKPVKTPAGHTQGVFDKEKKFSLHQFGVVYDALTALPAELRTALKLLVFSPHPSLGSGAVSDSETGTLYLGYRPEGYMQTDKALFCTTIHEAGHLIETNSNVLKSFRNICFDFANRAWQKKPECQASDFAPQLSEDGKNWNNELRIRSAGGDGREDIANAIEYYVCAGNLFRAEARARPKMKEKYLSLKELFNGKEYQCEVDGCLTLVPASTPCGNNGCTSCRNINDPCTTTCNDCPKLAGCRPGMDCKTCNPKHPDCKYWTCKNSVCGINQW